MGSEPQPAPDGLKMRANRKVIESKCGICGGDFTLGEEVYSCAVCGGYHHVTCLESAGKCPQAAAQSVLSPNLDAFTPGAPVGAPTGPPPAAEPAAPAVAAAPTPSPAAPAAPPTAQAAAAPAPAPAIPEDPPEVQQRKKQLAETYGRWTTEQLDFALRQERHQYEAIAIEAMAAELTSRRLSQPWVCFRCRATNPAGINTCVCGAEFDLGVPIPKRTAPSGAPLAPDERKCPTCAETIKRDALKCRFCGQALTAGVYGGGGVYAAPGGGTLFGTGFGDDVPPYIASEINSKANTGLTLGIIGLFICTPILAPMAIVNGNKAINLLDQYPAYEGRSSSRGKARAAQILGWIGVGLIGIFILMLIAGQH